jgi:precorrin-2/cobalt-factor-2 C20-methyltransferase
MLGKLSVIGIGPGDPELLTLKAVRVLKESKVLCVPKGREKGTSLALSIVEKAVSLEGKEIMEAHFPMMKTRKNTNKNVGARHAVPLLDTKWNTAATDVLTKLRDGFDVVFPTLGDPTIYSTFFTCTIS